MKWKLMKHKTAMEWINKILFSLIGVVFIAIGAQLSLSLPESISAAPITAQSLAVLLVGYFLGDIWGAICCLLYLVLGLMGLPLFSKFNGGLFILEHPSFAYLIGFIAAAYYIGHQSNLNPSSLKSLAKYFSIGTLIILAFGFVGLLFYMGPIEAFNKGILPFLIGAVIKIFIALMIVYFHRKFKSIVNASS